jgi:type I restriction enzyme S subunit
MNWQEVVFETLYSIPSGNGLSRPSKVRGIGYKFINMGELFAYDRISSDIEMERVQMNDRELSNMLVEEGDLLFARQSLVLAGAGKCSIVKQVNENTTFESHIIRVRLKKEIVDPNFYYYYFRSPICKIKSIVTQGVQAGIRGSDLKKLKVHIPPLPIQQKIANILSKYDDLIENNRRRIELLEESARLLYKEWFVYLRFPGHEHTRIIDGIPEGWEKKQVKDIVSKVNPPKKIPKSEYLELGSIPCIDQSKNLVGGYTDDMEAVIKKEHPVIIFGDHTRILKFINFPFASGADGTQIIISKNDFLSQEYLYFSLDAIDLSNYFYARHFKFLKDQYMFIAPKHLIKHFTDITKKVMEQIKNLHEINFKLKQARDLLLPKLMNGEIEV